MRRRLWHHALALIVLVLASSLAGCYTMLRHPDVSDQYDFGDEDQRVVVIDRCGACHGIIDPPIIVPILPPDDGDYAGGGGPSVRPIDNKVPIRKEPIGPPGDIIVPSPGGSGGASGGTDTKTRDNPTTPPPTEIKKDPPDSGKTPERRDNTEDTSKTTDRRK